MRSNSHGGYCSYASYDIDHEINTAVEETKVFIKCQSRKAESKKDRKAILKAIATTIIDSI